MAKPPCILFLLDWRPTFWSTREEFFRQLSQRLAERGITPVLTVSEEPESDVRRRFEAAGAHLVACSYHQRPLAYWRHIRETARKYSLLIAHVRFFDYFTALQWMCRFAGVRCIVFTEANSGEWNGSGWKAVLIRLRTSLMCRPLVRLIAISEFIRDRLIRVGIPAGRIDVVYNGVDTSSFHPDAAARLSVRRQMGAGESTVVLIFAAVLLPWKRPEVALGTCAELARRGVDAQLWMAGDGPLRESLEMRAKALGASQYVRWLGHQRDPQRWFAGADLFLHTALGEAFGNVLVEALASGLPVIASRSGATPELVIEGQCGRLVAVGPTETGDFATAIQEVTADTQRRRAMSEAAVQRAAAFPTELCVERTLKVYETAR